MEMRYTVPKEMTRGTHYGNNYWMVPSAKMNRFVTAFSNLEYYNIIMLEMSAEVEGYCEQPCELEVPVSELDLKEKEKELQKKTEDEEKHVIPDVYVLYKDGTEEIQEWFHGGRPEKRISRHQRTQRPLP